VNAALRVLIAVVIARSDSDEAIQGGLSALDCFACARNDASKYVLAMRFLIRIRAIEQAIPKKPRRDPDLRQIAPAVESRNVTIGARRTS
jgi:hypothetical protein